ncbi:AraC family transcriptional regulator [Mucilaginibacter sp. PPCGB 2223]|uniref:AraC family transcriptional regulator n=1 Tax=Mucilaginibacter sp. PPCGB 2223 TaxID=1886027 RepID=UPI000824F220|nr:AraC family transcriptional regulator [Mucilaginibacter sp. PPCGB 2223]OCX53477.1 AraC family transcriptional regulator [Mucilaginibacter sp. PPCGB 2223]
MNPQLFKISASAEYSFSIKHDVVSYFYNQLHYHPEVELVYIIRGTGSRFIGDSVNSFTADELVLIGSNVPHLFRNDDDYYNDLPGLKAESVTLHFLPEIFGAAFLNIPENKPISELLEKAQYGITIHGHTKEKVRQQMEQLGFAEKSERIILLLQLLNTIAAAPDNQTIAHFSRNRVLNKSDESRLNRIYQYTLNNYNHEITLKEIASIVYMVPHSFCRYFRQRTKKRYSQFLLEVRVSQACKLLSETDYSVAVVCYESGFKNFSNFNRHFKAIIGKSPLEYRKSYRSL